MDKFCLKWYNFYTNIRDHFKKLRADQRLFDVTLATDDGQFIQAHKMVLSAGSSFFNDIFLKNDPFNMGIYLKGIKRSLMQMWGILISKGCPGINVRHLSRTDCPTNGVLLFVMHLLQLF